MALVDSHFRKTFLLVLVSTVTIALMVLLWTFLLTIVVAAIMAGLLYPVYVWLGARLGGRTGLAAGLTLLDLTEKGSNVSFTMSHVAARQEMRDLLIVLQLPELVGAEIEF